MSGGTSVAQVRNTELVDILSTDFIKRNETTVAWKGMCSMFQMLPGLRGFWPMSSSDETGAAYDLSGQGRTLSYNGNPAYSYFALYPFIALDGTGDYLTRADEAGLDITGTETTISGAMKGLTMGGWFRYDNAAAATENMIGKRGAGGPNLSYYMRRLNTGLLNFEVSTDGTNVVNVSSTSSLGALAWIFCVGRFDPSTELAVFSNGSKNTNLVGVPASIANTATPFSIGTSGAGTGEFMTGRASLCFLTASALPDTIIQALYHHSRHLFGV